MATSKTTTASGSYIVTNGSTTVNFTPSTRADVLYRGVEVVYSTGAVPAAAAAIALQSPIHVTNPGVFTVGTSPEGTTSNPTNDSNG